MSGKVIETSLAAETNGQTNWARLQAMTEAEIERGIESDVDAFGLADGEALLVTRKYLRLVEKMARSERSQGWSRPLRRSEIRHLRTG